MSAMRETLKTACHLFPVQMVGHITKECLAALETDYSIESHGTFLKMFLSSSEARLSADTSQVVCLTVDDLKDLNSLYAAASPSGWFDPRMLETRQFFGVKKKGEVVSAAGIHVYSERYRVAALGSIATHPDFRNMGYCTSCVTRLCSSLFETVDGIGLNVQKENLPAIKCYERIGFRVVAEYEECGLKRRC